MTDPYAISFHVMMIRSKKRLLGSFNTPRSQVVGGPVTCNCVVWYGSFDTYGMQPRTGILSASIVGGLQWGLTPAEAPA